jgi:HPt (histidine-containing phosphotransfer) domain-containing protein
MEGDREKCLAAGMDDYITKPVRPELIAAVIERWVKSSHETSVRGPIIDDRVVSTANTDENDRDALDVGQIGLLRGLDDGEGAVLAEIIGQYIDQSHGQRDALADAIYAGDARAIERAAHSLRGASANVGGTRLAEICGELEGLGRAHEVASASALLEEFDTELSRVQAALSHLVVGA